jgi:hypothetical protein
MSNQMAHAAVIALAGAIAVLSGAAAATTLPDDRSWLIRMIACKGDGVLMEVYLPHSVVFAPHGGMAAGKTADGYYTLDLTEMNKGKDLEPVHVTMSADKTFVMVDQYTRGLPPTRIPVGGGTVDFDHRFGVGATCGPFRAQDPNYGN